MGNPIIKWQEVIEPAQGMKPELRTEITVALEKISTSKTGQQLFLDIRNLHNFEKANLTPQAAMGMLRQAQKYPPEARAQVGHMRRDRKNENAILIHSEEYSDIKLASPLTQHLAAIKMPNSFDPVSGIMSIDISAARRGSVPKKDRSGKTFLEPIPLDEVIAHELRHVVDGFKAIHAGKVSTRPCLEANAVETENAYRKEKNPTHAPRYAYVDPDANITHALSTLPPEVKNVISNQNIIAEPVIALRTAMLASMTDIVALNKGCTAIDANKLVDETSALLQKHGVSLNGVALPALKIAVQNRYR